MSLPFTSVVSYHTNPMTCGVAKFSTRLAERLGVPFVGLWESKQSWGPCPLFSMKWAELSDDDKDRIREIIACAKDLGAKPSVFWHDSGDEAITNRAEHVFYADPSLGSPGLWCPSLITPKKRPVRLFSFGMAHKLQTDKYKRVRELFDAASIRYHLRVSVFIHEGTSLDGAEKHFDALKQIMGDENVTILGILSDDAVSEELANCDYVLAFFEKGLRANNTTVHAAIEARCRVIANTDDLTPKGLGDEVMRLEDLWHWDLWTRCHRWYSWNNLISEMKGVCERSTSTAR